MHGRCEDDYCNVEGTMKKGEKKKMGDNVAAAAAVADD
jgi:hypothetical protein